MGTYTATGTDTDPLGDTGTWSYQLTVLAGSISQSSPAGGSVTVGSALSDQLVVTGNDGTATFTQSTGDPQVTVSGSGAVSAPDDLAVGTYTATGTDTDPLGDTGTWSYQLTVLAGIDLPVLAHRRIGHRGLCTQRPAGRDREQRDRDLHPEHGRPTGHGLGLRRGLRSG